MSDTHDIVEDNRKLNVVFIHSRLDDAGLTAAEFRVYCHLARRAGKKEGFPGIDSVARVCQLATRTVVAAIQELEKRTMISVVRQAGKRSVYRILDAEEWTVANGTTLREPLSQVARTVVPNATLPLSQVARKEIQEGDPKKDIPVIEPKAEESKKKIFSPPTLLQVTAHLQKLGYKGHAPSEAQAFIDHHETRGWFLAKGVKMKSWEAAVGTWKRNSEKFSKPSGAAAFTQPKQVRMSMQ